MRPDALRATLGPDRKPPEDQGQRLATLPCDDGSELRVSWSDGHRALVIQRWRPGQGGASADRKARVTVSRGELAKFAEAVAGAVDEADTDARECLRADPAATCPTWAEVLEARAAARAARAREDVAAFVSTMLQAADLLRRPDRQAARGAREQAVRARDRALEMERELLRLCLRHDLPIPSCLTGARRAIAALWERSGSYGFTCRERWSLLCEVLPVAAEELTETSTPETRAAA